MTTTYPASERQVDYLTSLLNSRIVSSEVRSDIEGRISDGTLSNTTASTFIDILKASPIAGAGSKFQLPVGMYRTSDGTIYRVHESRDSGRRYAKRMDYDLFSDKPRFVYEKGGISQLTLNDRMTLEQAKAWGVETGFCCVCGAFLTDEKSVANGIGPVCAKIL